MSASSFGSHVRSLQMGLALAALGTAASVHAQNTLYVDASAPAGGAGMQWSSALRNLQDALFFADTRPDRLAPITIKLAAGIYTPDLGTLNRNATFTLHSGVSLIGGFAGTAGSDPEENDPARFVSVLSGDLLRNDAPGISTRTDNSYIVLTVTDGPNVVAGLTIRGGVAAIQQAGSGGVSFTHCTIVDNNSSELTYTPYFISSVISVHSASLIHCTIADNLSTQLRTVTAYESFLQHCVIAGNVAIRATGNAYTLTPLLLWNSTLDTSLVAANRSSEYGTYLGGSATVTNCTFADNEAPQGPGCYAIGGPALVENSIFVGNTSASGGGRQIEVVDGLLSLSSCLLTNGVNDVRLSGGILASTSVLAGDPGFVNRAGPDTNPLGWRDNDYRLSPGSPAIDRANTTSGMYLQHVDLLGHAPTDDPATANAGVGPIAYLDLGAYEFIPTTCRADFNDSGSLSAQDIFDFLNAWFTQSPLADFNNSGTLSPQDIFDFLNAWFAGC